MRFEPSLNNIETKKLPKQINPHFRAMMKDSLVPHIPLDKPVRVTEQDWPENVRPVVSVRCMTYQHVNFIRDAIEGFLMQETTFPIEILIHDDASTDGTAEIVREYADRHPQLIRAVLQTENQYSKGNKPGRILSTIAKGEFMAICEGDDYWTHPRKLAEQVSFLVENTDCSLCHHLVMHYREVDGHVLKYGPDEVYRRKKLSSDSLVFCPIVQTCAVLYRVRCFDNNLYQHLRQGLAMGDWPLWVVLGVAGRIGYINTNMAVYRVHDGGVWSSRSQESRDLEVESMRRRLARCLPYRFSRPWLNEVLRPWFDVFYANAFDGSIQSYLISWGRILKAGYCVHPKFIVYLSSVGIQYFGICLRQLLKAKFCSAADERAHGRS